MSYSLYYVLYLQPQWYSVIQVKNDWGHEVVRDDTNLPKVHRSLGIARGKQPAIGE